MSFALEEVERLKQLIDSRPDDASSQTARWVPRASVFAGETAVTFLVELPGVDKEDVAVTLTAGELVVRGERKPSAVATTVRPLFVEQEYGMFERRFPVPIWGRPEGVTARCNHGILEVTVTRDQDPTAGEFSVEIA